ncbi:flagellar hook protein FlgE [Shinella granuli]|uniref:Flagellar hook protein FlgE n=1 Tax=Shinella granuli TaxID=323621 RepID=A0A4V2RGX8_SHIGR|nr:flagellar hook protein FlgE [Shinella granuli]TCN38200.1 flagellar hook-basal body protein [Shinella granuli]
MSLYGTMRTGVSGMNAQANRLSTVADNIANANTTGYKKASTQFSSLILPSTGGAYNSGGVNTSVRYSISAQGTFTYTTSATDLAINGKGFFIVTGSDGQEYMTRAGAFTIMDDGTLQNSSGFKLMGYEYSSTTDPTIVVNGFDGLQQINLSSGSLNATGSSKGVLDVNLPSNEPVGYTKTTSLVAYDQQGNTRLLDYVYTKVADNEWTVDVLYNGTSIVDQPPLATSKVRVTGNLEEATLPAGTATATVNILDKAGNPTALDVEYTRTATGWDYVISSGGTPIPGGTGSVGFDATGKLVSGSPAKVTVPGFGEVEVDLSGLTMTSDPTNITIEENSTLGTSGGPVTLEFDAKGKLFKPMTLSTGAVAVNGTELGALTLNIGGSTQLSSAFDVSNGKIDGNGASKVTGYEISDDGIVYLKYENGDLVPKFRVAMANVQSPDKLKALPGNIYSQSSESGVVVMGYAGTNGYGSIISGALEDSNVDIAEELTSMIESQRNYTANSKVFQTGSELMEVLVNLKR